MENAHADAIWTIRGVGPGGSGGRGGGESRYVASGPGVIGNARTEGNTISLMGTLPVALQARSPIAIYAEATAPELRLRPSRGSLPGR